jgi:hypothetical protein
MFSVVLCQIAECDASTQIQLVDVKVQPVDFGPNVAILGEILDQPNWNLAFNTFTIRFPSGAKEQYPGFALTSCLLLQPTSLMPLRHFSLSFRRISRDDKLCTLRIAR